MPAKPIKLASAGDANASAALLARGAAMLVSPPYSPAGLYLVMTCPPDDGASGRSLCAHGRGAGADGRSYVTFQRSAGTRMSAVSTARPLLS
ncbi:hypothetical protein GCM10010278_67970 [Streptomyces melanogenes]|nr:hypothetical protein GCM10010278_67970 [Streptomyces melanogenes]